MEGRTRSVDIYNTLSNRIITWTYPPGHRLTEEEVCAEFGVSRSPVREALNRLASSRLIAKEEHKGYTVRQIDIREINELYDTRLVLETAVVNLICKNGMDPAVLASLRSRWCSLRDKLPSLAGQSAVEDELFHEALAEAAGNRVMCQMLGDIAQRIHFVRLSDITDQQRLRMTCTDHLELLDALSRRDGNKAREVLKRNIEWGREKVDSAIKEALFHAHHMA